MSTFARPRSFAVDVRVDDEALRATLADGRTISAPLSWFPRLESASDSEREDWRLIGEGEGIHWPALDEDVSIAQLLGGTAD